MNTKDYKLNSSSTYLVIFAFLIALGIAGRLLPHPPNFTPMAAIALFAGFIFIKRYMAVIAVISTMLLVDYFAFGYLSQDYFTSKLMIVVYLSLLFPILFKGFLQKKLSIFRIVGASLASSTVFFIATNFAVWSFSQMYEKTFLGLLLCYKMAIPFFHNTVAGDMLWSGIIFGIYYALCYYSKSFSMICKSDVLHISN